MLEKLEVVSQMFHGFPYEEYFTSDIRNKLNLIPSAEEHILGLENGKRRYINEVTALSQAFALATPHEKALDAKDEVAFYQAVKARLVKFNSPNNGMSNQDLETAIRQVIDKALVTDKVIVKRILRQYGYPPDMELLATETILKQAELIAEELL
ncbi:MAG: DUF3387 domain-containing protein [Leptospira sp.]|nr:DUF3387 domain-containing protein [Leptospira sp.]